MTINQRLPRAIVVAVSLLVAAGCGQNPRPVVFDSTVPTEPSTTEADVTTTSSSPSSDLTGPSAPGPWTDVTGNLVGLDSECGNLSYVSARPDRDAMIVGVAKQGLWTSANGDTNYTRLGQGAGSATINNRTTGVYYDPAAPATFWQSGGYGDGVFKTTDDGATFRQLGTVAYSDLLGIDFTDPNRQTLVSGGHERPNVYRSTDGGGSWTDISGGLPPDIGAASYPHVIDANTFLLGTHLGASSGVFRTTDAGATWTKVYDEADLRGRCWSPHRTATSTGCSTRAA